MRITSALAVAGGMAIALGVTALPADATGYRYWSYYHQTADGWEYSQVRMDGHVPEDGAVEGWRFVTAEFGDETRTPRFDITFDDACGSTEPVEGKKRVALAIDYGRPADAPDGAQPPDVWWGCAVVDRDATTAMALSSVAELRLDDGRMCGLNGYPPSGCNEAVDPLPEVAAQADDVIAIPAATEPSDAGATDSGTDDAGAAGDAASGPGAAVWLGIAVALAAVVAVRIVVSRSRRRP